MACLRCRANKARCDGRSPCRSCSQSHSECIRPPSAQHVSSQPRSIDHDGDERAREHGSSTGLSPSECRFLRSGCDSFSHSGPTISGSWGSFHIPTSRPKSRNLSRNEASHIAWEDTPLSRVLPRPTVGPIERETPIQRAQAVAPDSAQPLPSGISPLTAGLDAEALGWYSHGTSDGLTESDDLSPTATLHGNDWQSQQGSGPTVPIQSVMHHDIQMLTVEAAGEEHSDFSETLLLRSPTEESWVSMLKIDSNAVCAVLQSSNIDLYFEHFNERWPLLHRPSFSSEKTPPGLLCSMALLGCFLKGDVASSTHISALHLRRWEDLMTKLAPVCTLH